MCNILNVSKTYYYKISNGEIQINEKQIIFEYYGVIPEARALEAAELFVLGDYNYAA